MSSIKVLNPARTKSRNLQIFKKLFVSSEFLRAMDSRLGEDEIRPSVVEPGEVIFRDARLLVKELRLSSTVSPRNSISELNLHVLQRSVADLSEEYAVAELTMQDLIETISRKLDYLSRPHPVSRRRHQDLLLRIEIRNCRLLSTQNHEALSVFAAQGWRSVSIIVDRLALILYTSDRAPVWLRRNRQKVFPTPQV